MVISRVLKIYKDALAGLSIEVWKISLLMLINRSGLMVIPFLSIYLTSQLGFTLIQAGFAGTVYGLGSLVASLLGGVLVDRYGYQSIVGISLLLGAISFWVLLWATDFYIFCSLLFFGSVVTDLLRPAILSSIKTVSKKENQTRAISLLRIAINLGIAIGPAVGGILAYKAGYKWLFIANGLTSFLAFLYFVFFIKKIKTKKKENRIKETTTTAYQDGYYFLFLIIMFLVYVSFIQIIFAVPLFFKEVYKLTELQVGLFFTLNGLMIVIFEMPIVHYYEKKNEFIRPILLGNIMMIIGFLCLLINAYWLLPFLLYSFFIGFGEIYNFPFFSSIALARSNDSNAGSYMGLLSFVFSLALTLSPIFGSYLISYSGFMSLWIACAALILLSTVLLWYFKDHFA